jgi:hypothetical protein
MKGAEAQQQKNQIGSIKRINWTVEFQIQTSDDERL